MKWRCDASLRVFIRAVLEDEHAGLAPVQKQQLCDAIVESELDGKSRTPGADGARSEDIVLGFGAVRALHSYLMLQRAHGEADAAWLHELLSNATPVADFTLGQPLLQKPTKTAKQTAELQERRDYLRARSEQRQYNDMVASITTREQHAAGKREFAHFRQQASIGASLLASLLTAGLAGYFLGRLIWPNDRQAALIMAVGFSTAMLLIDATLIILRLSRSQPRTKQ